MPRYRHQFASPTSSTLATGWTSPDSQALLPADSPLDFDDSEESQGGIEIDQDGIRDSCPSHLADFNTREPAISEAELQRRRYEATLNSLEALGAAGGFLNARIDELETAQSRQEIATATLRSVMLTRHRFIFLMIIACFHVIISLFFLWAMSLADHFEPLLD